MTALRIEVAPSYQTDPTAWAHSDVTTTLDDHVVTFDQGTSEIVVLRDPRDPSTLVRRIPTPARVGHGLTAVAREGLAGIWVVDPGIESHLRSGSIHSQRRPAWVGLVQHEGNVLLRIAAPAGRDYRDVEFRPTALVQVPGRDGEESWLADGYGSGAIYRYDAMGGFIGRIDGSTLDPPGFDTAHDLTWIDDVGASSQIAGTAESS